MLKKFFLIGYLALVALHFHTYATEKKITIIGIGRLGLCVALCCEAAGYSVLGVDHNEEYVHSLNNKTFYSFEPGVNALLQKSANFTATTSLDEGITFSDVYYIMVDTPTTSDKEAYDHHRVTSVLTEINKRKVSHKHIIIGSTIFPGYIRTTGNVLIQHCTHTTLSYNPTFIAQGDIIRTLQYPDIVLIGEASKEAGDVIEMLSRLLCLNTPQVCRMSPESAEITKLAINCFITTKIAYANMIADIADNTPHANTEHILDAVGKDHRIGADCLKAGYGFGGPCFPRDNRALGNYAQSICIEPCIPRATDEQNKKHAVHMANKFLQDNKDSYVFEKVTYKESCQVPIIEESQKLAVAALLAAWGKRVIISDTETVIGEVQKKFGSLFEYKIKH